MPEKKPKEKTKTVLELGKTITEISVAKRRSFEPFVKVFHSTGENVTKLDLGTLVGVFEVSERSEDSAYIVNFLASVAKKEYFQNPRRGAIESFESALQKVNLALAELVKHGNIAWLGELHGALGVFEKNNMHFSVTGEARILLLRNESISDISEGLASEESHIHPIKTFVEVSSGRLSKDDTLLFASPGLFSLFPLETLRKNASRMEKERFAQFLKTALVNELDVAGTLLIDIDEKEREARVPAHAKKRATAKASGEGSEPSVINVFSGKTFEAPEKDLSPEGSGTLEDEKTSEYVDTKTGHIYVQGEASSEAPAHPILEKCSYLAQEAGSWFHAFLLSQERLFRKARKKGSLLRIALADSIQNNLSSAKDALEKKRAQAAREREQQAEQEKKRRKIPAPEKKPASLVTDIPPASAPLPKLETSAEKNSLSRLASFYQKGDLDSRKESAREIPAASIRSDEPSKESTTEIPGKALALLSFLRKVPRNALRKALPLFRETRLRISSGSRELQSLYAALPQTRKKQLLIGIVVAAIGIGSALFLFARNEPRTDADSGNRSQSQEAGPAPKETAPVLRTFATASSRIIDAAVLNGEVFIVTGQAVTDTQSGKEYPIPFTSGTAAFASPMADLGLLFILSTDGELFTWSPLNKSFTKNTLPLPNGTSVSGIGTYLTYLYVLDRGNNQIYRFPRAEGGFGEGASWLRDPVTLAEQARFEVNEKVFLSQNGSGVSAFFRGKLEKELPFSKESAFTDFAVSEETGRIFVLDTKNRRVLAWDQDGNAQGEYASDKLGEAGSITFVDKTSEILFSDGNILHSLKIETSR